MKDKDDICCMARAGHIRTILPFHGYSRNDTTVKSAQQQGTMATARLLFQQQPVDTGVYLLPVAI